ncbi:HEAT repeat domain-containing protein [Aeromonas veronii]|uniref:HEAT repeat domain-containing protein n=1 Tax=Aeromonas veronii TaxID=654 RepID=A0A4S5CK26_AERVE|nr:HEAT repeat domain-containing protein [Aeromonas veronii]THJ45001.1 HEAT repeat domain-containing protein [Aeromonas veronii]
MSELSAPDNISLAISLSTPPELLAKLAFETDPDTRCCVAGNAKCPEELLIQLAQDENPEVRARVAENQSAPVSLLVQLSEDWEDLVREGVAANPSCPIQLLTKLAVDDIGEVRSGAARNPDCPIELLVNLAVDKHWLVRSEVFSNPKCPIELFEKFDINDDELDVCSSVIKSPKCPIRTLIAMANDPRHFVMSTAQSNLRFKDQAYWVQAVFEGFSLSTRLNENTSDKTCGDALLDAGLTDAYQAIQAAEISRMVTQATSGSAESAVSGKTMASIADNLRM